MIGLATIEISHTSPGTIVDVEHTVDAVRRTVRATVVPTPFFNPKRKTQTPPFDSA
jgi:glycine cleavage system aminomethyltransferase T